MYAGSLVGQQRIGSGTQRELSLMIPPETANVGSLPGLPSERISCIPVPRPREARPGKGRKRPVSANENGKWVAIWVIARRVAAPVIPLLLGAAAMALILDSGTVHLPPIRAGAGSSAAPAEKVVVSPPAVHRAHHRAVTPANTAAPTSSATGTTTSGVNTSPTQAGAAPKQ